MLNGLILAKNEVEDELRIQKEELGRRKDLFHFTRQKYIQEKIDLAESILDRIQKNIDRELDAMYGNFKRLVREQNAVYCESTEPEKCGKYGDNALK